MQTRPLGQSGLHVSAYTLGTMTYGVQTSESDAFAQMDMAIDHGINAFDTAELYPVLPISRESQGESERIIGRWLKDRGMHGKVMVFSKIVGAGNMTAKDGEPIDRGELERSLERSLNNLGTDCIDLYQLHWPNRGSYHFRRIWDYEPSAEPTSAIVDNLLETLETLSNFQKQGKIRAFGSSNDTAWGIMKFLELSRQHDLIRIASTQNEYSLMSRIYEPDLQEIGIREDVGLLSYTSLAGGLLSGKYGPDGKTIPQNSRRSIEPAIGGRIWDDSVWSIAQKYINLAQKYGMDPVHFAYRFCLSKPFLTSVIIGATTKEQLAQIFAGELAPLAPEILAEINAIHKRHPLPY